MNSIPATGRYIVDTEHDTYDVDQDARIAIWHDLATEARGEHVDLTPFMFDGIECTVGLPLWFDVGRPWITFRGGSTVIGITPVHAAVR